MAALALPLRSGVVRALDLPAKKTSGGLPRGALIELTGGASAAATSSAVQIALASQREGDPVAWIQPEGGALFPPDLARAGIDLAALLVVHTPDDPASIPKAAELALRTGAFGALVLDLSKTRPPRGDAWLGRLATLAREHDCRCVLLGPDRESGSFGPLVGVRLRPTRVRVRPGLYRVEGEVLKDKSGVSPSLEGPSVFRGPEGMP